MTITIRKAELSDVPAITDLVRGLNLFAHVKAETPEQSSECITRHLGLCLADDSHSIYVAETDRGEIAGYGAVHWLPYLILAGPEGYVSELFLRDSFRGQGIGRDLLDVIKQEAKTRGCARLMLLNMRSRESYQRQFYAKQGWQEREDAANFVYYLDR